MRRDNLVTENGEDLRYGYLGTREYYDDFDLTVEFKQVTNGNSGLFFHSFVEGGYKNNIVNGWQCEVAPQGYDTGGIYESYGRGWLVQIPDEKESILKEGGVEHAPPQSRGQQGSDVAQRRAHDRDRG